MCHLSLEKMLKGMYSKIFNALPPKNHNLVYFIEILELKLIKEHSDFIGELNLASVATRYPEDLAKISKEFTQINTKQILIKTKDILQWLKNELMK
jgi:HEPN domain-containing protein